MVKPTLVILIPFIGCSIFVLKDYFLAKKVLALIKNINYDKWLFLTSSSLPVIKHLVNPHFIWVNQVRFERFIKSGEFFNDPELERCIQLYKRNKVLALICVVVFIVSMLLTEALLHS